MKVGEAMHTIHHHFLDQAHDYAIIVSGCRKVAVGSLIVDRTTGEIISAGANRAIPDLCKTTECLRIQKYGDDSKNHRNPEDCRAIHSEIDAIAKLAYGTATKPCGMILYVTRYPCEACARAIGASGISTVVYGRQQEITEETRAIFESEGVEAIWMNDWVEEDTTR